MTRLEFLATKPKGYTLTHDDIRFLVRENNIRFIRLQFTDIFGTLKNVALTDAQLDKALAGGVMFDGSSIEGFVRIEESDQNLRPCIDSFEIYPWRGEPGKTARMICDVYTPDGQPFEGDPRYVLRRALDRAAAMGYAFNVGPELEFFLFEKDGDGDPTTVCHDEAGYFDLGPVDMGEDARRDVCMTLEKMGFEIEAAHHECAPGQHEIDFKYADALTTADNILTFKQVVKVIAAQHNLHATFMPKPRYGLAGNGMHINMSLSKDGRNVFHDPDDKHGLSQTAYHFMAGIMDHIRPITGITNPLVNSYKRLIAGFEAPIYIAWSARNRSPLVRIPSARGSSTRIELRSPDPTTNPYLALAVCLCAGLDGIERGLTPPEPVDGNIFDMDDRQRSLLSIDCIPQNLGRSVAHMKNSPFIRAVLGEHIYERYVAAKEIEWNEYCYHVSDWEVARYLRRY